MANPPLTGGTLRSYLAKTKSMADQLANSGHVTASKAARELARELAHELDRLSSEPLRR